MYLNLISFFIFTVSAFTTTTVAAEFNQKVLTQIIAEANESDTENLIIYENGKEILRLSKTSDDELKSAQSITKSFSAIIYLLLMRDSKIKNLDVKVSDYISEFNTPSKKDITFRNILTQTAGFSDPDDLWTSSVEPIQKALITEPAYPIYSHFIYSSMASMVLGTLFKNVVPETDGNKVVNYLNEKLLVKIGVNKWIWPLESNNTVNTSGGIWISANSLLKLGLFLNDNVNGLSDSLIHKSWLQTLTDKTVGIAECYSLMTWLVGPTCGALAGTAHATPPDAQRNSGFYFDGYGGQFLVVIPSKNIVAVRMRKISDLNSDQNLIHKYSLDTFPDLVSRL